MSKEEKDNDKAKKFSSSIPADAGNVSKETVKYRSDSGLTQEQYLQARYLRLQEKLAFDEIACELGVTEEQIKIALRGIRTKSKNPKRGTLNADLYSREIILRKSKELGEPVYKILQRLLTDAKWVRVVD